MFAEVLSNSVIPFLQSYNNHEKATSVLLEHGANVTLTDDRGLNPLDFAKTRKMKKRLQEAWTEVKSSRSKTSLGPIRTLSREDLRSSIEDLSKKKKGEVIFEVTHQILNMLCGIFCTIILFYVMQDSFTAIVFDCSVQIQDMVCR